jgi:two-component system, sensor histidine kinase and response regulator
MILYKAGVIGGTFHESARIKNVSGQYHWMEIDINSLPQDDGSHLVSLLFTDINTTIERQSKLDSTYSELLGVMNNTPGGIVVFDTLNNRTLVPSFFSQGMGRLLEGTPEQLVEAYKSNPFDCVHPDDRDNAIRTVEEALRNLAGFQLTVRLRTIPGSYRWVTGNGTIENVDNQRLVYMAFVDSSADTEVLHIQKQILDSFVRHQYQYICLIDVQKNSYQVISSTTSSDPFLSGSGNDFQADFADLIKRYVIPEKQGDTCQHFLLKNIVETLEKETDKEYYCTLKDDQGRIKYKKIWLSWADKEMKKVALVTCDVTEEHRKAEESRMALEAALKGAEQASAAKSEFLARMSHDIRTPLNAIIGYTDMCLEDKNLSEATRDYLVKAESSSHFLLSLINDILNMSRIESGKLVLKEEPFDLSVFLDSLSSIVSSQCIEKSIQYRCQTQGKLARTYIGDRLKVQQILLNVLGNSVKFTPEGGNITLFVKPLTDSSQPTLSFTIKDSGCGIAPEFLPHVFEPFSQERRTIDSEIKGTGLGLAIVKSLLSLLGGTIQVESTVGVGTTFAITIPFRESSDTLSSALPEANPQRLLTRDFSGRHILLAEDNALNAEIARHVLEKINLQVDICENGKLAVERFQASATGYYSAILMDIRMPVMDGLEASRAIRKLPRNDRNLPIIAMSANAFDEDIRLALSAGVDAYTIKPIDRDQLYATLSQFIK